MDTVILRLKSLCNIIPPLLSQIDDAAFAQKPGPNKWSKKEILGHLIDSATNNHQRFVRVQFENKPHIVYDQNQWNVFNFYQYIKKEQLIAFWCIYNLQLVELIQQIPAENLNRACVTSDGQAQSLAFLIEDYVAHLEHHLKQIVNYSL